MTGEKAIALFYLLFEGVMLFQVIFFGMVYLISRRKDTLFYSLLNLFTALYLGLNAPDTILGINENLVFDSLIYLYVNFALFLLMFITYTFFLKEIFLDTLVAHPYLNTIYRITCIGIPAMYVLEMRHWHWLPPPKTMQHLEIMRVLHIRHIPIVPCWVPTPMLR